MNKIKFSAVLLAVVLLASALPVSQALAANTVARLDPASQNIQVNQTTTVSLYVQDVQGLYGYQVSIAFNPLVLEVIDADAAKPGIQVALGSWLQADFVQANNADNSLGAVLCVVSQLAPAQPVNGSGTLLTITFRGKANGSSNITFTDLKMANMNGNEIAATRQSAQITVGSTVTPTPVPPTATPVQPTPTVVGPTPTTVPPTATPVPPTPVPGQTVIYVVRSGDTLYSIARQFGVSVQDLIQINNISNPSRIYVGQHLTIPRGGSAQPTPAPTTVPGPTTTYIVQAGDTLYSIARRFNTTVDAIALLNRIANPSRIFVGQRLTLPGSGPVTPPVPDPTPAPRVHVVQAGETLYSIARRYGVSAWAIAMANNLYNMNVIYPGQRLTIP